VAKLFNNEAWYPLTLLFTASPPGHSTGQAVV